MMSVSNGTFNIKGLDAGSYVLKETTVPGGYNALADTPITIAATHKETDGTDYAGLDLGTSSMNNTVINQSGSSLPSTGGMGTTLLYIIDSILTLGAGIILVSRRRSKSIG